jgi:hypothetical protein
MDILKGSRLLSHGDRKRIEAHWASAEFMNEGLDDALVHLIKTIGINVEHLERSGSRVPVDNASGADLGKVPDPAQEIVGDARRSTGTTGNLKRPL